jgi:carbonic anhydrase/acetyltransferase-like protein (isoleucine patch superfamily)
MATLVEFDGRRPRVAPDAWLAPTATLIGDVEIAGGASVWFGTVLRADFGSIRVGTGTCVQDNAVVHCAAERPTLVGDNVTVGHVATLEGCGRGRGSDRDGRVVLQRARVGVGAKVAAGSVVTEGGEVAPAAWVQDAAREHQELVGRYRAGARVLEP